MAKKRGKKKSLAENKWENHKKDPELWNRILENDKFFSELIDFIPPEHWGFDKETQEKIRNQKHMETDRKLTPNLRKKFGRGDKQRLARQDPDQPKTVTEIWDWLASTSEDKPGLPTKPETKKFEGKKESKIAADALAPTRAEALSRLQTKIEELRKKRRAEKSATDVEMKRKLKRRASKLKRKERKSKEKEAQDGQELSKSDSKKDVGEPEKKKRKTEGDKTLVATAEANEEGKTKEIRNAEGKIVYSKFDFAVSPETRMAERGKKNKRGNKNKFVGKDYGRLLKKVENRAEKLERLERTDEEKADRMKKNVQWDAAMQKAEGGKVKDNPELLKKSLKRKEEKKERSRKKWEHREDAVKRRQQQKQDKRQKNIRQRKDQKKQKKIDRARKRK